MDTNEPRRVDSRVAFSGRVVRVACDRVVLPNGHTAELEVVRHPGATAIVALSEEESVFMVRQYRYATGGWLVELPAGKLEPGESPIDCARRELEEEIGFRAGRLEELGVVYTTPGFADERIWFFLAQELEPAEQKLEADEVLEVEEWPLEELWQRVCRGEIQDSKTICALTLAWHRLRGPQG